MTLVLALKCASSEGEAVLICADSKATVFGGLAYRVQKIYPVALHSGTDKEKDLAIASGEGYESMVRHATRIAEKEFTALAAGEWRGVHPTFAQFEDAVAKVESRLITKLAGWKQSDLDISLNMILCGVDPAGKASIYVFDDTGLARPVHDSPGFACIGSGFVTGGNMILQQFWTADLPVDWAQSLAAYTIQTVSKVDTAVGPFEGASWFFRVEKKKPVMGELKVEGLASYLERVRRREDALKQTWETCDKLGETEVLERLRRASPKGRTGKTT
jgi:hypothetical protein